MLIDGQLQKVGTYTERDDCFKAAQAQKVPGVCVGKTMSQQLVDQLLTHNQVYDKLCKK